MESKEKNRFTFCHFICVRVTIVLSFFFFLREWRGCFQTICVYQVCKKQNKTKHTHKNESLFCVHQLTQPPHCHCSIWKIKWVSSESSYTQRSKNNECIDCLYKNACVSQETAILSWLMLTFSVDLSSRTNSVNWRANIRILNYTGVVSENENKCIYATPIFI